MVDWLLWRISNNVGKLSVQRVKNLNLGVGLPSMDDHDDYCLKDYRYHFHPDLLKGKIAFISGGASGIGFRISELLMRHGCDIVIASRNIKKLEEVSKETTSYYKML